MGTTEETGIYLADPSPPLDTAPEGLRELLEQTLIVAGASAIQLTLRGPASGGFGYMHAVVASPDGEAVRYSTEPSYPGAEAATELAPGSPIWTDDVASVAGQPLAGLLKGQSIAGVELGLEFEARSIGALHIGFEGRNPRRTKTIKFLCALARQTSIGIASLVETQALKGRVEQSRALADIARISTSTLQLDEMLDRLVAAAARLTHADRASIWLLSPDGERLLASAMFGVDEKFLSAWKEGDQLLTDQQLSREALESGTPVVVLDAGSDPRTDKAAVEFFGDKSILIVPLTLGLRAIGTLYLNHIEKPHSYTAAEIQVALAIASQATSAIENARLYTESEEQRERLRASFRRLGDALGSGPTLDETLQLVVNIAREMMDARACVLELEDQVDGRSTVRASAGEGPSSVDDLIRLVDQATANGPAPAGLSTLESGASLEGRRKRNGSPDSLEERSPPLLSVALSVDDHRIGSLSVAGRTGAEFSDEDMELLAGFAGGAAVAIQRSTLEAEVKARLHHLSGLYSLSQAISSLGDFNETLAHIVDQIATVLDVERCVILLLDDTGTKLVGHSHAVGLEPEQAASMTLSREEATASWDVLDTGEPFVANDSMADERLNLRYVDAFGDENLLIVPMRVGESPVGVIRASNKPPPGFSESDARLMNIFATQAAVIVQNATLFREVMREARQLEAIISEASDGIAVVDSRGQIIAFNAAMESLTGWPRAEAIGRDCEELIQTPASRAGDDAGAALPLKTVLETKQSIPYSETVLLSRDGNRVDVGVSYSYVPSPWDESPLAVAIVRDISALKEVEGMKSDFVSLVSHELRTPLALIKGYIATLLRPDMELDPDTRHRFQIGINEAADRLGLIVHNLLSTSRIESGLFRPHRKEIELVPLVERVVSELQESAHGQLELLWRGEGFRVVADGEQISLVLGNLIGNSIKYAGPNQEMSIRITVDGRKDDIKFTIRDRGIGIPKDLRGRIFEKFYRGPESQSAPGTGLGLYICRKVIEAHGGMIELEGDSEPGTQISFVLPRRLSQTGERPELDTGAEKDRGAQE